MAAQSWLRRTLRDRAVREARRRVASAERALAVALVFGSQADLECAQQDLVSAEANLARLTRGAR